MSFDQQEWRKGDMRQHGLLLATAEIERLRDWLKLAARRWYPAATIEHALSALTDWIVYEQAPEALAPLLQASEDAVDGLIAHLFSRRHTDMERALIGLKQAHGDNFEAAWQHLTESET